MGVPPGVYSSRWRRKNGKQIQTTTGITANFCEIFLIFALEIAKHQKAGILEKTSFVIFIWGKTKSFKLEIIFFKNMFVFSLPSVSHQQLLISTPSKFFRPAAWLTNLSVTVVQHWSKEMKNPVYSLLKGASQNANSWDFLKNIFGTLPKLGNH